MTDSDRIYALAAFAPPGSVWIRNIVRDKLVLSNVVVPVRPVTRTYAEGFKVPFWNSLREAIDAFVEEEKRKREIINVEAIERPARFDRSAK